MTTAVAWLAMAWGLFALAAFAACQAHPVRAARACGALSALGSLASAVAGGLALAGRGGHLVAPALLPFFGVHLAPDPLSGWFLVMTGVSGAAISIYAAGYAARPGQGGRALRALFPLCLGSLPFVAAAGDWITFLAAWEVLAVTSYVLVALGHEREAPRAALLMVVTSEAGSVLALAGFALVWVHTGVWTFDGEAAAAGLVPAGARALAFLLVLVGLGVKFGLVPLHVWLPAAHPAAPSHVSALLSAAIVNLGAYGILRALAVLGPMPVWLGGLVTLVGALTAATGVLYAMLETDLKRMLAHSTVENMGVAAAAFGAGLLFQSEGALVPAALAFAAGLLHLLNHSAYKGLLFMAAGTIQAEAGTRDMDLLGGIARRAPWLGVLGLVGVMGLAAVPPVNGFVGEWLVLQTMLHSFQLASPWGRVVMVVAGSVLALVAGVAVTAFVRAYGVSFLGLPRTPKAADLRDARGPERWGMALAGLVTLGLGVLPTLVVPWLGRAVHTVVGVDVARQVAPPVFLAPDTYATLASLGGTALRYLLPGAGVVLAPGDWQFADVSTTYMWVAIPLLIGLAWLVKRAASARHKARAVPTWAGGGLAFQADMQYTATAYAVPERNLFARLYLARSAWEAVPGSNPYFPRAIRYEWKFVPMFEEYVFRPLVRVTVRVAERVRSAHSGSVHAYVVYLLLALVLILALSG